MPKLMKDYTGQVIGTKTVLGFSHWTRHNDPVWKVQCQCGNIVTSLTQNLKHSKCRICCNNHLRKRPYESVYNSFVYRSSKRNVTVDISYEQFAGLAETKECHYCGDFIQWTKYQINRGDNRKSNSYHLDRMDNDKPYTMDNVVVCCTRCNLSKADKFSYEEWKQIGNLIRSWK